LPVGADEGTSVGDIVGWVEGIEDTVGFNEGASLGAVEMEGDAEGSSDVVLGAALTDGLLEMDGLMEGMLDGCVEIEGDSDGVELGA
jgi:hypothetical protein